MKLYNFFAFALSTFLGLNINSVNSDLNTNIINHDIEYIFNDENNFKFYDDYLNNFNNNYDNIFDNIFDNNYEVFEFGGENKLNYFDEFNNFINKYEKKYNQEQFNYRFIIFSNNLFKIKNHEFNFELEINEFTDLTEEEFKGFITNNYLGKTKTIRPNNEVIRKTLRPINYNKASCQSFVPSKNTTLLLNELDWRQLGAVTLPKDQGKCGSCWSFSASGAMEGAWAIKHGELISLSEQHLIDCSTGYNNNGCQGGLMDSAFEYVIDSGGMCSEAEVPYEGKQHLFCKKCNTVVNINSCVDVTPNNQVHLKEAVSIGPVSVAIEADTSVFQFYSSGVIDSVKCGTNLDHGVLIVGYGTENGKDYWLVKNSWGLNWGDGGFVKIARSSSVNDEGICGIAMQPSYPVV
jgi:C1A family cysteine protease